MDKIVETIRAIIAERFPGCYIDLERTQPYNRIFGHVVWQGFEGQDITDRQEDMWLALERKLGQLEQLGISAILTLTPDESSVGREDD